ncbi:MAG: hypothetical protein WD341_19130 [Tistlia sp.]|uniref:hypothetical protein n=1 Tax=Tistlia sp. TaxID=3057121 RepID=UPI0034A3EF91
MATAEDFEEFFAARAAFVSQRSAIHYCYARAGVNWDKLLREEAFAAAMEICRWEAYAATASGLGLLYEGMLREAASGRELILAESLVARLRAVLDRHAPPAHDPEAWDREAADFRRRIGLAQQAAPLPAHALGGPVGQRIFAVLPIHRRLRAHDELMVENSVRFAFVNQYDEATACFDTVALAHVLAGSRAGGHGVQGRRQALAAGLPGGAAIG